MEVNNYKIALSIDENNHEYLGSEQIYIRNSDDSVELNSVGLEILSVKVEGNNVPFTLKPEDELLRVLCGRSDRLTIDILFKGKITRLLTGLYVSKSISGEVFTTQFEPSGARRMFPCIDNPNFKATFNIELEIDKKLDVISNTSIEKTLDVGSRKRVIFVQTPIMSTYLVYLAVGKFDVRVYKRRNMDIIMAAPHGTLTDSNFPLEVACSVLDYMEEYFEIKLPLTKIHLVSIPDTGGGAMENWGAIKFADRILSIDSSSSASDLKRSANVIAHELAHQWFGDLVTMKWWNDLWLNESFATFMAYKVLSKVRPDWNYTAEMVISRTGSALWVDAMKNTHPIDAEVTNPEQVAQLAKEIRYDKGASILRMLENYLGEENFRKGISSFLNKYKFRNATGIDLWNSIEETLETPVRKVIEPWIHRPGYPIVHLEYNGDELIMRQERFTFDKGADDEKSIWSIPMKLKSESGLVSTIIMEEREKNIAANIINVNADYSGFYRTVYPNDVYRKVLSSNFLTDIDYWGICNDTFAQFVSSRISFDEYILRINDLMVLDYPIVIREITDQLFQLYRLAPLSSSIARIASKFALNRLDEMGEQVSGETMDNIIARAGLKKLLVMIDNKYAKELSNLFKDYYSLDANEREAVALAYAVSGGNLSQLTLTLNMTNNEQDRERLISAMGWLGNNVELNNVISMFKNGELRRGDLSKFILSAANSPTSRKYITETFNSLLDLSTKLSGDTRGISRIIEGVIPIIGIELDNDLKNIMGVEFYGDNKYKLAVLRAQELVDIYKGLVKNIPK